MKRVKVKKKISPLASFCETIIQENKDLRVQVAHTEDEITILKQRNTTLEYENKRLQEEITQLTNERDTVITENTELIFHNTNLQEELDTYKKQPNSYWEERAIILSRENEELKQKLAELEK